MTVPLDADEFLRWREHAAAAAQTAGLADGGGRHEWACFLYEQAAQLAVKGLLHALGLEAWGHDLAVLESRVRSSLGGVWPHETTEAAARLSRHYIPARYPDAHASGTPSAHYTPADAAQAERDAGVVLSAVDDAWASLGGEGS